MRPSTSKSESLFPIAKTFFPHILLFVYPSGRAAKNIFLSVNLGNWEKIVCEMKVLFTIAYIQYTIGLQLYLSKRYIDKVTDSGFQAIKVFGDVENE